MDRELRNLLDKAERVDQGLLRTHRRLDTQVHTARDDWGMVEIAVNGHGDVLEVALDPSLVEHAEPIDLAEAVLEAARAAQQQARAARKGGGDVNRRRTR